MHIPVKWVGVCVIVATLAWNAAFTSTLKPTSSLAAAVWYAWISAPSLVFAILLWRARHNRLKLSKYVWIASITLLLATLAAIDIVYLEPDPQGGLALIILPFLEIIAAALLLSLSQVFMKFR